MNKTTKEEGEVVPVIPHCLTSGFGIVNSINHNQITA